MPVLLYVGLLAVSYLAVTILSAIVHHDRPDCWPWKR